MKDIINPWVIAGSILIASILIAVSFLAAGQLTPSDQSIYSGDAIITVIPVPTYTPTPLPTQPDIPVATPTVEPAVGINLDGYVKISGTEGEGLRLRRDPSLDGEIVNIGLEGEIFRVIGGPEERDGYLWWQLETPLNSARRGWAVSNYLEFAQSP